MPREEYIAQAVIDAMKQARIGRNLTQKELAKKMNVSVQARNRHEIRKSFEGSSLAAASWV